MDNQQQEFREAIKEALLSALEIDETDTIESIEENAGGIWIKLSDGRIKSFMAIDCEPEQGEETDETEADGE